MPILQLEGSVMRVMLDLINEQLPLPLMLAFCIRIVVAGVCGAAIGY